MNGRRWAYAGAGLGAAVSVAANVAHSYVPPAGAGSGWVPEPGAVASAVFWPVALLFAVEILARVTWPAGWRWRALRWLGLIPVALVAAGVSYQHLSGLLSYYGEPTPTALVGPLAVDGLMVMATGALIATSRTPDEATDNPVAVVQYPAPIGPHPTPPATGRQTNSPALAAHGQADRSAAGRTSEDGRSPGRSPGGQVSRPDTAVAIAHLRQRFPEWTHQQIADRLGISDRTVRRHLNGTQPPKGGGHEPVEAVK